MRWFIVGLILFASLGCKPKRIGDVEEMKMPVTVKFTERDLTFTSTDGTPLVGTLMVPAGSLSKSYPCVLLISGSGPTDRNGNQPNLKVNTMKQMAVALAGAEIASFRFDKRAVGGYASQWPKDKAKFGSYFSWRNHLADAFAAWRRMREHGLVDKDRCAILGHSEGGLIALSIALEAKPKALVLAATPGRRYGDLIHEQLAKNLEGSGSTAQTLLSQSDQIMATIKATGKVPDNVPLELRGLFNSSVGVFFQQASRVSPTNLVKSFAGPILVVNGESDVQVDPTKDAKALLAACEGRKDCRLEELPLASHNFKAVTGPQDAGLAGPVVPDFVEALNSFLVPILGGKLPDGQLEVDVD